MPTSSAKPARLLKYRNDGVAQVEGWEPEVGHLTTALTNLREALSGLDLPDNCRVASISMFYENWFESLTQSQRHLDEWVGDVGNGFLIAQGINPGQYNIDQHLNDAMTVDDGEIQVGYADMFESEAQAREDARALDEILGDYGLIHPYELANNPELLEDLAEQYPELRDILARTTRFANDESYAAELVNTLGPQDVRTLADLTNSFGLAQDRGLIDDDAYLGYVVPLAGILGAADRSGRMDRSVRDAIFDMDATDEEPIDGTNVDFVQEGALEDMRYRSLALLVSVGGFSPQTTADMANAIIQNGPVAPTGYGTAGEMEGFTNPAFLQDHQALASNQYAALVALQGDDHAANIFYRMDNDHNGEFENLYVMQTDGGARTAAQRLGISEDEFRGMVDETVANTVRGGILEYPMATDSTYSPETIELVTKTIEAAGWEHMNASDPVRQALAQVSTPYTTDIAIVSAGGGQDLPDTRLPGLDQGEIDAFMREVSESEGGRMALSQNAAALVRNQIDGEVPDIIANDPTAMGVGERLGVAYYADMGEAWDAVQVGWQEQREALVAGWQTVTDPVLDIVSGKIVERVPGGNLPVASDIIDGISGEIKNGLNDAIYNTFIPEVPYDSMQNWRDAMGADVNKAVATSFYENKDAQDHYLQQLQQDDPALYQRINADGEVTLEEFRGIPAVQDAVNTYGGEIVDGFQTEMAFDKIFPKD
jgi:hypothetical protein